MKRDDLLDLNDALQHPGRIISVDLSTEMPDEEDVELVTPLEGFLEAYSTGTLLILKGEFKTRCTMQCARCGGPLEQDVLFDLNEDFPVEGVPSMYAQDDHARVVADEPYPLFHENSLIVETLLHQALIVNMPQAPLCTFGWDGDCPEALKRNVGQPQDATGKLSGLSKLLPQEGESS